jgi:hypothetical protein
MTKQEIELLGKWQKQIDEIERNFNNICKSSEWLGNGSDKLAVYFPNVSDYINIAEVPDLKFVVMDIIRSAYSAYLEQLKTRRNDIILCHEEEEHKRRSTYTPIEID